MSKSLINPYLFSDKPISFFYLSSRAWHQQCLGFLNRTQTQIIIFIQLHSFFVFPVVEKAREKPTRPQKSPSTLHSSSTLSDHMLWIPFGNVLSFVFLCSSSSLFHSWQFQEPPPQSPCLEFLGFPIEPFIKSQELSLNNTELFEYKSWLYHFLGIGPYVHHFASLRLISLICKMQTKLYK